MLVREYRKTRDELKLRRSAIDADVTAKRQSLMAALSLTKPNSGLHGEYIMSLSIGLNELLLELKGVDEQIAILSRELDG